MPRRAVTVLAGLTAVLITPAGTVVAVAAAGSSTGSSDQRIDRQATRWRTAPIQTPRQKWGALDWAATGNMAVSGGSTITVPADGVVTATLSGTFTGGPVEIRVRDGRRVMRPGPAHFTPHPGSTSFSYTFLRNGGHPLCGRHIRVQWRAGSDATVTMQRGDVVVTYQLDRTERSGNRGCV